MEMIGKFIIFLLAAYGALVLLLGLFSCIRGKYIANGSKFRLVLVVNNAGGWVEYVVYSLIKKILSDRTIPLNSLTVVDMASDDDTPAILSRLRNDFGLIELLSEKEKEKVFKDF